MANGTEELLSDLSESSFVILGQGSLPSDVNNDFHQNSLECEKNDNLSQMINSGGTTLTQSSDASLLENNVKEKLKKLYEENYYLKETLSQNNLAIKSQLNTFVMWQQEVLKTHETHKQKFLETKDLILKLRAENLNLKKQIEKYTDVKMDDSQTLSCTANMSNSDLNSLNKNIGSIELQSVDSNAKNDNLREINYQLVEKLKDASCKIKKLSNDLDDATKENNLLKQKLEELQSNSSESFLHVSLPNSEARAQISNLFKQLEEERDKTTKLKEELELLKSKQCVTEDNLSTTEELTEYLNKLDDMNLSFNKGNQRYNSFKSWISLAEENLNAARGDQGNESFNKIISSEIAELKSHLHKEANAFKKKQETLQEMHNRFSKLLQDYKDFKSKIDLLEKDDASIQHLREEVESLSAQLKTKDEELELKKHQIEELQENIKELNLQCEEMKILRVQVQVYQTDFNDERQARERLVGEKEEMAEQIRLLQSRIQSFEEKKGKSGNSSSESTSLTNEKMVQYTCPSCLRKFSDLKNCQQHVEECINNLF